MADKNRVKKATAFLTDDRARANMPDARPVEHNGRDYTRQLQREVSEKTPEMDAKVKQWLKDNPGKRYLYDYDATDADALYDDYQNGKNPENLSPEEVAMVRYGHDHGSLYDDYDENYDNVDVDWSNPESVKQYRENQFLEKRTAEEKEEPVKAEENPKRKEEALMSFLKGKK